MQRQSSEGVPPKVRLAEKPKRSAERHKLTESNVSAVAASTFEKQVGGGSGADARENGGLGNAHTAINKRIHKREFKISGEAHRSQTRRGRGSLYREEDSCNVQS
jgi:hypothetical protein